MSGLSATSQQQKAEKMKRILFTVCMLLGCVLFTMAQEDSYKIEGKLGNTVNGKLLLVANTDKGMLDIGEATVTNGEFEFTGRMPEVTLVYLMPMKKNALLAALMLENAHYTITMGTNELVVEGGGEAQKIWREFNDLDKSLARKRQQIQAQVQMNPSQEAGLQREFKKIVDKADAEELALLKKYNNSFVAAYVVASKMAQILDDAKLKERYEALGEEARATIYGKQVADELVKLEKVTVGAVAPNFSAPLADGGVLSLHETKAKVKVVDFWASWCLPCRQENVNLIKIYKRYRPKGLEIISVSIDDNKQAWLSAIGQDGCDWKNVSDLKGGQSEIAADYCVKGIPCTFILDGENRIVAKNLRGKDLEKKIDEMLKKKK
ncbi:MAG TPA: AhpC/TSA family protein [Butyricimonas virosa]|nr:AhpC/TSA family protein [Butyricimonas virosa]HAP18555.1 AhpC/TSA family protein [Butyricimonas virosa]